VEAFLASLGMVTLAEMGDKTQLLSFILAARFIGRPWPIIGGIFAATTLNHLGAAAVGTWVATHVGPDVMRWVLGIAFLGFAAWALIPDKLDDEDAPKPGAHGAFWTTMVAFFIAEMGDKTQFATIALGAQYAASLTAVVLGTTLGMMAANIPAVLLGEKLAQKIPLSKMRFIAAALFAIFGVMVLMGVNFGLGFNTRS
jgi:putative Ca2+/H+ antiporter (TMEM165/GDT1 family)